MSPRPRWLLGLSLVIILAGCQGRDAGPSGDETSGVTECDAYLDALQTCLERATAGASSRTRGSLSSQRGTFREQVAKAELERPGGGDSERARLAGVCRRMSTRLVESCR